ncbi:UPF0280 family protein [Acuticoccus yangtzensis]|uniref:UPF0280 family protein n=1 Tax=Acuticoccus yangtzensis TaxID=1443441 RepID=UPI00094956DA|nr:UPF0280 family protein [Acuticoccus yangtzensis]ORE95752.1 hypothetical protein ATO13_02800 [Stappia sp. 22II-S9-Z10]
MMTDPTAALLPDGRLHLQHGPIDVIVSADGSETAVEAAFTAAAGRFATVLTEIVEELSELRLPARSDTEMQGLVASRMTKAVRPFASDTFITPMAAVAGAVADEILDTMTAAAPLTRAFVNNGGDIAVHLSGGQTAHARIAAHDNTHLGTVRLRSGDGIGGIATSGRTGRSLSLGIADSVTVLAASAAEADAAATLLANAVDLPGHPAVERAPAETIDPDSDLGSRLVTTGCGTLTTADKKIAIGKGARLARQMLADGTIRGVAFYLQGEARSLGWGDSISRNTLPDDHEDEG